MSVLQIKLTILSMLAESNTVAQGEVLQTAKEAYEWVMEGIEVEDGESTGGTVSYLHPVQ